MLFLKQIDPPVGRLNKTWDLQRVLSEINILIVLASKKTLWAILVSLSGTKISPFLKLHCNIYWYVVLATFLFQNVSSSKCLLLTELITEMLFLSEQSPFFNLYLCCKPQCFSVLTQFMPNRSIKKAPTFIGWELLCFDTCLYVQCLNIATSNTWTFCRPFLLEFDWAPLLDCWIIVHSGIVHPIPSCTP